MPSPASAIIRRSRSGKILIRSPGLVGQLENVVGPAFDRRRGEGRPPAGAGIFGQPQDVVEPVADHQLGVAAEVGQDRVEAASARASSHSFSTRISSSCRWILPSSQEAAEETFGRLVDLVDRHAEGLSMRRRSPSSSTSATAITWRGARPAAATASSASAASTVAGATRTSAPRRSSSPASSASGRVRS